MLCKCSHTGLSSFLITRDSYTLQMTRARTTRCMYYLTPTVLVARSNSAPCLRFDRRFEHLGDSVLGLVVTDLLRDTFPYLRVGPITVFGRASSSRHAHRHPGHRKSDRRSSGIPISRPCKSFTHPFLVQVPHFVLVDPSVIAFRIS